jgi:hypothetical protein
MIKLHNCACEKWNKSLYILMKAPGEWTLLKAYLYLGVVVAISGCGRAKYWRLALTKSEAPENCFTVKYYILSEMYRPSAKNCFLFSKGRFILKLCKLFLSYYRVLFSCEESVNFKTVTPNQVIFIVTIIDFFLSTDIWNWKSKQNFWYADSMDTLLYLSSLTHGVFEPVQIWTKFVKGF